MTSAEESRDDHHALLAKLDRLSELLFNRDPEIVSELWSPGFRLIGSEFGEIAETCESLVALIRNLFDRTPRFSWDWARQDVSIQGRIAWIFAEGHLVQTNLGGVERALYRLVAVFEKDCNNQWKWRLLSGSEPA